MTTIPLRARLCSHPDREPPQQVEADGAPTWISRGAHFVVAVTRARAGTCLVRADEPHESMLLFADAPGRVEAGGESLAVPAGSLLIVPPGASTVTAQAAGLVVRMLSAASSLAGQAGNAAAYHPPPPDVAPFEPWPAPPGGFRLRHYHLPDHLTPGVKTRVFRCTSLMVNLLAERSAPRDIRALSPHAHGDFEQASVVLAGSFIHHLRHPWGPDMTLWRPDEALEAGAGSVLVIPPGVIHTSRNPGPEGWLMDVFAPPRADFSRRPGMVLNAADYPMPESLP